MRILVSGGAGSIGSELVRQLIVDNSVFIFDTDETRTYDLYEELKQKGFKVDYRVGDIRDRETVRDAFSDFKPEIIYHAAAYKHVSPMEKYPIEAITTNILGTWNLIDYAKRYEVKKFIFISTDKAVNGNCVMGATKRVGEIMTKNAGYTTVRFGNVLGSRGSVLEIWKRQIESGEPMTITDPNMERYFMTIPQACELVIEASKISEGGEVILMDMGERWKIIDVAKEFAYREVGTEYPVKIIGVRPGETKTEELMTLEEKSRAIKVGKFFIIH